MKSAKEDQIHQLKTEIADLRESLDRKDQEILGLMEETQGLRDALIGSVESMALKSEFLKKICGMIQPPLKGVLGMTELLSDSRISSNQKEYIKAIRSSVSLLMEISKKAVDFSMLDSGKPVFKPAPFHLGNLVDQAARVMAPEAHGAGLDFSVHVEDRALLDVWGDPIWVKQVLIRLLENGIRFTQKGEVGIRVKPDEKTGCVGFEVFDTGPGLPRELGNRIFEPFVQKERSHGGVGLGLAIVERLVKMMGGRIEFGNLRNGGAVFTCWLPFQNQRPARSLLPEYLRSKNYFVLSRHKATRDNLAAYLRSLGASRVCAAANGKIAKLVLDRAALEGTPFYAAFSDQSIRPLKNLKIIRLDQEDGLRIPVLRSELLRFLILCYEKAMGPIGEGSFTGLLLNPEDLQG